MPYMERFTSAIRMSVVAKNWYAALAMSLTLPDICGFVEDPKTTSKKRYAVFFDRYLRSDYVKTIGGAEDWFLSGEDLYALRCAYLHQGGDDLLRQKARKSLEQIRFIEPQERGRVHRVRAGNQLALQVDLFCEEMCAAVENWEANTVTPNSAAASRCSELLTVYDIEGKALHWSAAGMKILGDLKDFQRPTP